MSNFPWRNITNVQKGKELMISSQIYTSFNNMFSVCYFNPNTSISENGHSIQIPRIFIHVKLRKKVYGTYGPSGLRSTEWGKMVGY